MRGFHFFETRRRKSCARDKRNYTHVIFTFRSTGVKGPLKLKGTNEGTHFTTLISGEAFRSRIGRANVRARTPLLMLIKTPRASIMIPPALSLSPLPAPLPFAHSFSLSLSRVRAIARPERSCARDLDRRSCRRNSEPRRAKLRESQSSFYGQKLAIRHYVREESYRVIRGIPFVSIAPKGKSSTPSDFRSLTF